MIKALLIDDEERAIDSLQLMIEKFIPEIEQVRSCSDASKCVEVIHEMKPDLVFLDVRMPHLSGFDILSSIPKQTFSVIFTTAYDEYAIKAIRFSALDYLLKPVDVDELINAVKRFMRLRNNEWPQQELFRNITHNMQVSGYNDFRLALPSSDGVHFFVAGGYYTL